jgi:hypothetical protein
MGMLYALLEEEATERMARCQDRHRRNHENTKDENAKEVLQGANARKTRISIMASRIFGPRKQRTRKHVIADQSVNHIER